MMITARSVDYLMRKKMSVNEMENNIKNAIVEIRNELLKHEDLYDAFISSITSALKDHWCCGLPFEPEEDVAKKILDYVIGGEYEEKE